MAFYVCDGSSSERKLGAGIIRTEGFTKSYYTFTTDTRSHQSVGAECFAIHKVTELIRKFQDRHATIVTDFQHIIDLYYGKRIPVRPVPPWVIRALCDLKDLRNQRVDIHLRHRKDIVNIPDFAASHRLSRAYKRGEVVSSDLLDSVTEVAAVISMGATSNESIFEENIRLIRETASIPTCVYDERSVNQDCDYTFIFQKVSSDEWGVFDRDVRLLLKGRTLVELMNTVFFSINPSPSPVRMNEHAMHVLEEGREEQSSEAFVTLVSRMMLFSIATFKDFPFNGYDGELQEVERFGPTSHYIKRELG
ncbi:hypothetical protein [Alteribacter aurantiacus]|uniref:hypothetical protein n=1 Tax=Alteribacter aurantiacus TaxID=254410 RepID=UPI0004011DD8|nr:hypothetical protein [Alteribacter aurantiacus]